MDIGPVIEKHSITFFSTAAVAVLQGVRGDKDRKLCENSHSGVSAENVLCHHCISDNALLQ